VYTSPFSISLFFFTFGSGKLFNFGNEFTNEDNNTNSHIAVHIVQPLNTIKAFSTALKYQFVGNTLMRNVKNNGARVLAKRLILCQMSF
jgi:hypothetical protein